MQHGGSALIECPECKAKVAGLKAQGGAYTCPACGFIWLHREEPTSGGELPPATGFGSGAAGKYGLGTPKGALEVRSYRETKERYGALRAMCGLYKVFAVVAMVVAVVCILYALWGESKETPRGLLLATGAGLGVAGLVFFAAGESLWLAIHVEENTRVTAQLMEQLLRRLKREKDRNGTQG